MDLCRTWPGNGGDPVVEGSRVGWLVDWWLLVVDGWANTCPRFVAQRDGTPELGTPLIETSYTPRYARVDSKKQVDDGNAAARVFIIC